MDGITIARAHHVMIMPASHWPFANHVTPPHGHVMSPNHAYALSTDIEVNVRYNWLDYAHWGSHEGNILFLYIIYILHYIIYHINIIFIFILNQNRIVKKFKSKLVQHF